MAFWGTEVKPGKPFTHTPLNRRLHVSLATLGLGKGTDKIIVQCNVGNKKALFLCSLFPNQSESFPINVEFEESDEVVFSVMGSRPVHLTGYYLSTSSLNHRNDDESESYGEDINDTESEKSKNSQESEYDSSFIDDDEPSLELSAGSESNEEMSCIKKVRRRRLRKMNESEDEETPQQKDLANGVAAKEVGFNSDIEDTLPISSLSCRKIASKTKKEADDNQILAMKEESKKETDNDYDNEIEDDATMKDETNDAISSQLECQVGSQDGATKKRKRKEHLEGKSDSNLNSVPEDASMENNETQKKRKKKKRCKDKEGDAMNTKPSVVDMETKNGNNKEIKLSNGIIVEELEMGKPDGKIASIGKKVRVHYTAKLKESGKVIDSSVGKDCLKFRLGGEKAPELWSVAIDGMQVGGKRRLTVPPSVSYNTSDETSENIPANSWMIFEVELIKVR